MNELTEVTLQPVMNTICSFAPLCFDDAGIYFNSSTDLQSVPNYLIGSTKYLKENQLYIICCDAIKLGAYIDHKLYVIECLDILRKLTFGAEVGKISTKVRLNCDNCEAFDTLILAHKHNLDMMETIAVMKL